MTMHNTKRFVELGDIAGVRFACGCGQSIEIRTDELTTDKLASFFAHHVHSDTDLIATVNEDRAFLNGRLGRFFTEDLKRISEIAERRKLKFSFEVRESAGGGEF